MPEPVATALGWLVPAVVVFAVAAGLTAAVVWAVRRARRSPRARAAAETARASAGAALVRLDDAVSELDLEVALSGALYGGDAPPSLRRARMSAQHARDDGFARYGELSDPAWLPGEVARRSARIQSSAERALTAIGGARTEHGAWVAANVSAAEQVAAASRRLTELRRSMGDPGALVRELSARFDPTEWRDAASAAAEAITAADEAQRRLEAASSAAADPSRSALPDLAAAERALRRAQTGARTLEETHRVVLQAAEALPVEFESLHAAVRQALPVTRQLEPDAAERLTAEIGEVQASAARLAPDAARRPTATVAAIARARDRLDTALGDARTAQQRIRGARTALPGTLSSARGAIARAEASVVSVHTGADARVRLARAQEELAAARTSTDPVAALDAARRAIRHAEDAKALADHDRLVAR